MTENTRDVLDTSVIIDHDVIDPTLLPDASAISAITLADLLMASAAAANNLPVYTRDPCDVAALTRIMKVIALPLSPHAARETLRWRASRRLWILIRFGARSNPRVQVPKQHRGPAGRQSTYRHRNTRLRLPRGPTPFRQRSGLERLFTRDAKPTPFCHATDMETR